MKFGMSNMPLEAILIILCLSSIMLGSI